MTDSLLYSETDEHLANLDHCGNRGLRRAYLAVLIGALRAGYQAIPRLKGDIRELQIRDAAGSQPYAVIVKQDSLGFYLRQPALRADPELAMQAQVRFADRIAEAPGGLTEVCVPIRNERDADDIADWLFIA